MKSKIANKSIFFREHQLLPCPFCGGEVSMDSCDRIISFICEPCGYRRSFHGLVQSEFETPVVASYIKGTKTPLEWYDKDAYDRAAEEWNKRADTPTIASWPQPITTSTGGPIATYAPVVHCEECKYYLPSCSDTSRSMCFRKDVDGWHVCYDFKPSDFCSYGEYDDGERKTD